MSCFDLVVIGSGPAGQKAAIQAAKGGKKVALVERELAVGGACVHRGTIPSKTLREAAVQLASVRRVVRGAKIELGNDFAISNLMTRLASVLDQHEDFWEDQLRRNDVELVQGTAAFASLRELTVSASDGYERRIGFENAIIATGSRPRKPPFAAIDHERIFDSDSVLKLNTLPRSMIVLGGGVIAAEYASIFACLGVHVTMIDNRARPIPFVDPELTAVFVRAFERAGGIYRPDEKITGVHRDGERAVVTLEGTAEPLVAETALVALGRLANSDKLNLAGIGVGCSPRGTVNVDEDGWTGVGGIYAIGDVVGGASLASTAMDQGRRAARAILDLPRAHAPELIPAGIYTIPEISCVGLSEAATREKFGDVVVGRARYAEVARGCICGDRDGLLKLIAEPSELRVVGVHIVGANAAELVHVGQVALAAGWLIDEFIDNVFNFPTFAEAYRIAALDAAKAARTAERLDDGVVRIRRASSALMNKAG